LSDKSVLWIIPKNLYPSLYLFFLLQFIIFYNNILEAQWVQTSSLDTSATVSWLSVNGTNIFAGTYSGIYISTNDGKTWAQINNGLTSISISSLAFIGNYIFAGTRDSGIFISTNEGQKWTQANNGLTNYLEHEVISLTVSGLNIFAFTGGGLLRSTNNGISWTNLGFNLLPINITALAISGNNNIFVGNVDGIYRSTDNGMDWNLMYNTGEVVGVPFLAANENNVFAVAWDVMISTDNGTNWKSLGNIPQVYYMGFNGVNIFAATHPLAGCLFYSSNNGTNWTQINDGLPSNLFVYSILVIGTDVLAGTAGAGIWKRPLSEIVNVSKEINDLPKEYTLSQNYPNPFNPNTVISYSLSSASNVKVIVYNILGQTVRVLENGVKNSGIYSINFNASGLPGGIYYYRLEAGEFTAVKKMMLLK
jgi:photosystem II stability/assembly factor-like uncharacterized protein